MFIVGNFQFSVFDKRLSIQIRRIHKKSCCDTEVILSVFFRILCTEDLVRFLIAVVNIIKTHNDLIDTMPQNQIKQVGKAASDFSAQLNLSMSQQQHTPFIRQ